MLGFLRNTSTAQRPTLPVVGRPFVILAQCAPPSMVRYSPLFGPPPLYPNTVRRRSYAAAYRMLGLFGSMAISDTPVSSSMYNDCVHVTPPSVDLKTPRS